MYCIHCGTSLPDDARFCRTCGKAQSVPCEDSAQQHPSLPDSSGTTPSGSTAAEPAGNYLTTLQVSRLCKVDEADILAAIRQRRLRGHSIGDSWGVTLQDAQAFCASQSATTKAGCLGRFGATANLPSSDRSVSSTYWPRYLRSCLRSKAINSVSSVSRSQSSTGCSSAILPSDFCRDEQKQRTLLSSGVHGLSGNEAPFGRIWAWAPSRSWRRRAPCARSPSSRCRVVAPSRRQVCPQRVQTCGAARSFEFRVRTFPLKRRSCCHFRTAQRTRE